MKRRVHTWLLVVAGSIGLPLLAMCALEQAGALDGLLARAAQLGRAAVELARDARALGTYAARAQHTTGLGQAQLAAPGRSDGPSVAMSSEPVLMSCADPVPSPASPLWCEDTGDGSRCAPAAPDRSSQDASALSPVLASASFQLPVRAALPHTEQRNRSALLAAGRAAHIGVERPPRV